MNKKGIAVGWLAIIASAVAAFLYSGMTMTGLAQTIQLKIGLLGAWGPAGYVIVYSFRSLVFFPASVLTALGGVLFGPWLGIILTVIGENISANLSFTVGRYFGGEMMSRIVSGSGIVTRLACGLQRNGFMAVISMRLMYLPFDLVGYTCGVCQVKRRDFALGTFLGTIPGLATFVFIGSAMTDYRYVMVAGTAVVVSLILARYFKNKEKKNELSTA